MSNYSWKKTNAPISSSRTDDIWFIDEITGWAVNSNGQILFTSDGGNTWTQQAILPNSYLRCVSFADRKNGWVGTVTATQKMMNTKDGGATWDSVNNLPQTPNAICGLFVVNKDVVYAAGTNWPNRPTAVVKTIDGGTTWLHIDMSKYAHLLVDIFFRDPLIGWVVGGYGGTSRDKVKPVVLYTEDGGKSWINQLRGQDTQFPFGEWGWKIHFVNDLVGFVSLENFQAGAVLKTTDGGKTWSRQVINDPQKNANLEGIGFWDEKTGWVGGWGDPTMKKGYTSETNDGGSNWSDANYVGKFINRFRFLGKPPVVGYASGDTVYKYSTVEETPQFLSPEKTVNLIVHNEEVEIYTKEVAIDFDVPIGAQYLEINVWDRFGAHQATLLKEKNPKPGSRHTSWKFPVIKNDLPLEHYIYRVSIDDTANSRIVVKSKDTDGEEIIKSLKAKYSVSEPQSKPPLPTFEQEKEAFFRIANIEDYPDFLPTAKEMSIAYLANADYEASDLYNEFEYSQSVFDERMKQIYEAVLPDMYKPHRYDKDILDWSNGKKYKIGKASDKVVRDRMLQFAPFNLMDGIWLQNIMQARPSDEVQSRLFEVWADEVGNGSTRENHSNVYQDLLRSQGIYLPPVTSRSFLDIDVAPGAWRGPVFQMAIGLFAENFFPELLGMTLYLEWEATPTLMPQVSLLKGRGMNPLFYSLHVAIDNISEGHGALAKEAIKIFVEEKREEGGERAVQENWKRIWNGYVGWATTGFSGEGLEERRLIIDKVSINLGTPDQPQCFPDWKSYYHNRMVDLIRSKAPFAKQVHGRATIDGVLLNDLFDKPEELMKKLISSGILSPESPRQSKFFDLTSFDGPMYKVFTDDEKDIILDWLESYAEKQKPCIDSLPDTPSQPLPQKIYQLITDFSGLARRAHDQIELPNENGERKPLIDYLDKPKNLLEAMIRGGWIVPGNPERSFFISRILQNGGPMQGVFPDESVKDLVDWVNAGAELPEEVIVTDMKLILPLTNSEDMKSPKEEFARLRPFIGQGAVH